MEIRYREWCVSYKSIWFLLTFNPFNQAITWFSAALLGPFLVDPICHSRFFGRYDIGLESLNINRFKGNSLTIVGEVLFLLRHASGNE
jgi:hypothetical protein